MSIFINAVACNLVDHLIWFATEKLVHNLLRNVLNGPFWTNAVVSEDDSEDLTLAIEGGMPEMRLHRISNVRSPTTPTAEEAMSQVCRIDRMLELPRGNAQFVSVVGFSSKQSLAHLKTNTQIELYSIEYPHDINQENEFSIRQLKYSRFTDGIGDEKHVHSGPILKKILNDAIKSYNEFPEAINSMLFEEAMSQVCRIDRMLELPRGNAQFVSVVGFSSEQSLAHLKTNTQIELYSIEYPHVSRIFISAEPAQHRRFIPQGVLDSLLNITKAPPTRMIGKLHKTLDNINQDTALGMYSKETDLKAILFSLRYLHASIHERLKFGPQGWNKSYSFNAVDLTITINDIYYRPEANNKVSREDLRCLFEEIHMYAGHITEDWDRRLCRQHLADIHSTFNILNPDLVERDVLFASGFLAPPITNHKSHYDLNAESGTVATRSENVIQIEPKTLGCISNGIWTNFSDIVAPVPISAWEMQPRDPGSSVGNGVPRRQIIDINQENEFSIRQLKYSRFTDGIGDEKHVHSGPILKKILNDAIKSYNEFPEAINSMLFEEAMSQVCRIDRMLELPRGNAQFVSVVGFSSEQSLAHLKTNTQIELYSIEYPHVSRIFISAEPAQHRRFIPQGVLDSLLNITKAPPTRMIGKLHKTLDNINQDTALGMYSKETDLKAILFSLRYLHASIHERLKFGPQGWNKSYSFNAVDLTITINDIYYRPEANNKVSREDLRCLFEEIHMYAGHITEDWDRRLCRQHLADIHSTFNILNPDLVERDVLFASGFLAPPITNHKSHYDLNAESGTVATRSENVIQIEPKTLGCISNGIWTNFSDIVAPVPISAWEMQPRDPGSSVGNGVPRRQIIAMKKCPNQVRSCNALKLLNEILPGLQYKVTVISNPPADVFVECMIIGVLFVGRGSTKRAAKKLIAVGALYKFFGVSIHD